EGAVPAPLYVTATGERGTLFTPVTTTGTLCACPSYVDVTSASDMTGVALLTINVAVAVAEFQRTGSAGVNATLSVCVPASRIVPAGGENTNVPAVSTLVNS